MEKKVDAAIIGAGTAGINALMQIRKQTDDFVLINAGPLGTTCARVGCMPSKILIQIGDDHHRRQFLEREGIEGGKRLAINPALSMAHVRKLRDGFTGGIIEDVIEPLGDRFIDGRAEFLEPTLLAVDGSKIRAGSVVIATGSRPVVPSRWEALSDFILTTDTLFEQTTLPPEMAVVGLGPVGLELGQAMKRMGLNVTGFDLLEQIGGLQDPEVNRAATAIFQEEFPLHLGDEVQLSKKGQRIEVAADGRKVIVDRALLSMGRRPNVDGLGLERLGVDRDAHGVPRYDRHTLQIGDLPVFIAGDAANRRPVLHEVAHEGTVAGYNAVHDPVLPFRRKTPLVICFADPNICSVGTPWDEAKNRSPAVGSAEFDGGREKIMLRPHGRIRVYAERPSGRLLGAEMAAPHGEHLAHLLAWCIQREMTVFELLAMPYYHPTVEETLKGALEDLAGDVGSDPGPLPGFETAGGR